MILQVGRNPWRSAFWFGVVAGILLTIVVLSGGALWFVVWNASKETGAPPRPGSVPESAEWVGGVDGGWWVVCRSKNPGSDRYLCTTYFRNGKLGSYGEYVIRTKVYSNDQYLIRGLESIRQTGFHFSLYDGRMIHIAGAIVLAPDGAMVWPFPFIKGGKVVCWNEGEELLEVQYSGDLSMLSLDEVFKKFCMNEKNP